MKLGKYSKKLHIDAAQYINSTKIDMHTKNSVHINIVCIEKLFPLKSTFTPFIYKTNGKDK